MEAKKNAIHQQLDSLYDIRYNTITCKLEYKNKVDDGEYNEVTRKILKGFVSELKEGGLYVKEGDILKAYNATFNLESDPKFKKMMDDIELYISTSYELRYNTLRGRVEFYNNKRWEIVDKIFINNLLRELRTFNLITSKDRLWELLESNYTPMINPLRDYFENLEYNPNGDRIADLLATVKTTSSDWNLYFTRWLVATCANIFVEEKCTNHTMIILCGQQGAFKTTWIENLLPQAIKEFMFTGKVPMDKNDKDGLAVVAEYLIANMDDQIKLLSHKGGYESMKSIITLPRVVYRKPYERQITEAPHLASFIGSANGTDILADPTGDRRYLPFEVESIDIDAAKALDMANIWAEVYMLYKSGFRYYFTSEETKTIMQQNKEFAIQSPIEEALLLKFSPAEENAKYAKFMVTQQIAEELGTQRNDPQNRKLGEALTRNKFIKQRRRINGNANPMWGYWVRYNEAIERLKEYPELQENLTQKELRDLQIDLTPF